LSIYEQNSHNKRYHIECIITVQNSVVHVYGAAPILKGSTYPQSHTHKSSIIVSLEMCFWDHASQWCDVLA